MIGASMWLPAGHRGCASRNRNGNRSARSVTANRRHEGSGQRSTREDNVMLKWALISAVIAIIAAALGFTGLAGAAAGVAKFLFFAFLAIFVIMLILGIVAGKKVSSAIRRHE